jgi:hypothetical protein
LVRILPLPHHCFAVGTARGGGRSLVPPRNPFPLRIHSAPPVATVAAVPASIAAPRRAAQPRAELPPFWPRLRVDRRSGPSGTGFADTLLARLSRPHARRLHHPRLVMHLVTPLSSSPPLAHSSMFTYIHINPSAAHATPPLTPPCFLPHLPPTPHAAHDMPPSHPTLSHQPQPPSPPPPPPPPRLLVILISTPTPAFTLQLEKNTQKTPPTSPPA